MALRGLMEYGKLGGFARHDVAGTSTAAYPLRPSVEPRGALMKSARVKAGRRHSLLEPCPTDLAHRNSVLARVPGGREAFPLFTGRPQEQHSRCYLKYSTRQGLSPGTALSHPVPARSSPQTLRGPPVRRPPFFLAHSSILKCWAQSCLPGAPRPGNQPSLVVREQACWAHPC